MSTINYTNIYIYNAWVNIKAWDIIENSLSEAIKLIKSPNTNVCNSNQIINDNRYNNGDLNHNKELYYFIPSYFVTEPVLDKTNMEKLLQIFKVRKL